ncbi:unnamed protein product [Caenorhabditis sp. 36 PRJEB53466]|nr:unnamed protein product [Caenorhabditis sp. 36 PRJEB53466]
MSTFDEMLPFLMNSDKSIPWLTLRVFYNRCVAVTLTQLTTCEQLLEDAAVKAVPTLRFQPERLKEERKKWVDTVKKIICLRSQFSMCTPPTTTTPAPVVAPPVHVPPQIPSQQPIQQVQQQVPETTSSGGFMSEHIGLIIGGIVLAAVGCLVACSIILFFMSQSKPPPPPPPPRRSGRSRMDSVSRSRSRSTMSKVDRKKKKKKKAKKAKASESSEKKSVQKEPKKEEEED